MKNQRKSPWESVTNIYGNINYNVYQAPVYNGPVYNGPMNSNTATGNSNINNNSGRADEGSGKKLTLAVLSQAIAACRDYIWGNSAYAVLFGVVRDGFDYRDNMSQFEREVQAVAGMIALKYPCPTGTLASAFYYNPYLKKHFDNWKDMGVKERVLILKKRFSEAMAMAIVARNHDAEGKTEEKV